MDLHAVDLHDLMMQSARQTLLRCRVPAVEYARVNQHAEEWVAHLLPSMVEPVSVHVQGQTGKIQFATTVSKVFRCQGMRISCHECTPWEDFERQLRAQAMQKQSDLRAVFKLSETLLTQDAPDSSYTWSSTLQQLIKGQLAQWDAEALARDTSTVLPRPSKRL